MFPSSYLKPVIVNGKPTETDLSSIVTHTNHIGLRQHLASNHKILLNDDADIIAESYGLYNVNDFTKEHERNIILCGFDGFKNTSRTTGTTIIQIDDKRSTIEIATTGGKPLKNMKNWINYTGFDGSHNRFLYMSIPKIIHSRPQDFKVNVDTRYNPSLNHLCVIIHSFGTVRFAFQMSNAERTKFCGATFQQISTSSGDNEQTQTQTPRDRSAMFTIWNLIADLIETQDLKPNEQQQISDFYAKAGTVFPRLVCLMQLYYNASEILERVKDTIIFAEGDSHDLVINENFVNSAANIIKKDYHVYDKTYLPYTENNQVTMDPMVIVDKDIVIAAWKWYEHRLNIATKLFTIDHDFSNKPITASSLSFSFKPKTLKQLIIMFDYNIFPLSAISVKHPVTGQTAQLIPYYENVSSNKQVTPKQLNQYKKLQSIVHVQTDVSTPNKRRLNDSSGLGELLTPKQQRSGNKQFQDNEIILDETGDNRQVDSTTKYVQQDKISFDQVKRAVSSNLPCFYITFHLTNKDQKVPSAFNAADQVFEYLK
ncbi:unnamed protein product [Rotaria magnacalcarata]|uniref:Uncharacterized protein n=1 Tax=Rotaria magnacalcarata TaxID=392030 RepID=A0A816XRS6_9BILA|nr:unnamed protein product [Rotaria magnacalcarata]